MQSRRDQVQAHLFVMGRLASGMLRAEPDAPDTPIARTSKGHVIGAVVATLIGLVVALYGMVVPGGATGWQKPGTLVTVDGTGARYLYLGGSLHPVLNDTSARLLAGDQLTVQPVSENSLDGVTRGAPLGIVGAPDGLPAARRLTGAPWLVCAVQQLAPSGGTTPLLGLAVGPDQEGSPLADGQGVLVGAPDGTGYLLWHGRRLRLDGAHGAQQALGYATATPYPVSAGFLDALFAGPDLAAPDIPGRGTAGPTLAGRPTKVGQLFTGPAGERYALTRSGLVPLTTTLFDLLRGDPLTQREAYGGAATTAAPLGPDDLAAHTAPGAHPAPDLPADPPQLVAAAPDQGVCVDLHPGPAAPVSTVTLVAAATVTGPPPVAQPGVRPGCAPADRVMVRPGGGALVRALSGGGGGTTDYLVTDTGVKYPLASPAVARQLGYGGTTPVAVPGSLLALLPTGPSLDPALLAGGGIVNAAPAAPTCGG